MNRSEEAFLFSTFKEFCKCWRSGTRARVIMESMNGNTFVNFSAYLGHPDNVHFQPRPSKRNPTTVPRKKSEKKIKRDNDRAARFQEQKRKKEEGAASAFKPGDNHEAFVISTPGSEKSEMTISSLDSDSNSSLKSRKFSFASPVPEHDKSNDTASSMNTSDKPEQEDQGIDGSHANVPDEISEEDTIDDKQEDKISNKQDLENARKLAKDNFRKLCDIGGISNLNSFIKEVGIKDLEIKSIFYINGRVEALNKKEIKRINEEAPHFLSTSAMRWKKVKQTKKDQEKLNKVVSSRNK